MKALIIVLIVLAGCGKEELVLQTEVPQCIQDLLDEKENQRILKVLTQVVDGDQHYWLNTDSRFVDGIEVIVSSTCDTLCTIGGFRVAPKCAEEYDDSAWTEIYRKP